MSTIINFSEQLEHSDQEVFKALKQLQKLNVNDLLDNAKFWGWVPWS